MKSRRVRIYYEKRITGLLRSLNFSKISISTLNEKRNHRLARGALLEKKELKSNAWMLKKNVQKHKNGNMIPLSHLLVRLPDLM